MWILSIYYKFYRLLHMWIVNRISHLKKIFWRVYSFSDHSQGYEQFIIITLDIKNPKINLLFFKTRLKKLERGTIYMYIESKQ